MRKRIVFYLLAGAVLCADLIGLNDAQAAMCAARGGRHHEPALQHVMNDTFGTGALEVSECVPDGGDAYWIARDGAAVTLLAEHTKRKHARRNTFGIYDPSDPDRRLELFNGPDGAGTQTTLAFAAREGGYEVTATTGGYVRRLSLDGAAFGFYLTTPQKHGQTYFSDTALNRDGVDHMYAYAGTDAAFYGCALPSALRGQWFGRDAYLLAWEDLLRGGDRDYQDMLVVLQNVAAVPLPAALGLFAAGLVGLGFARRASVIKR